MQVQISSQTIQELQQKIKDDSMPAFTENFTNNYNALKNAAQLYLNNLAIIQDDLSSALRIKQLMGLSSSNPKDLITSINNTIRQAYQARQLSSVYFMDALDKYLNNLPRKAIFVVTDNKGKNYSVVEMSMEELTKLITYENRLVTNITKNKRQNYQAITIDENHNAQITAAYQGVNNRLQRYYDLKNSSQQQGGLLLFKESNDWTVVRVANEGVIKEAYAAAYLTKHGSNNDKLCQVDRGNAPYYSHSLIGTFYNYYMAKVTNAEAIIEEDIVLTDDGIQYGVKSRKAVFDTTSQTETVAKKIISSSSELSPIELKQLIQQEYHRNAQLAPVITNTLTTLVEDELDFINTITTKNK